jgi:2-haloacid dehalogenase
MIVSFDLVSALLDTRTGASRAVAAVAPEPLVHVAASARDVRGALVAGITAVRLVRPGHVVDRTGPLPLYEVRDASELAGVVGGL